MRIGKIFTEHPASVGESYQQHLVYAGGFGLRMVIAGSACMIHAVFPFLFVKTGSRAIAELNAAMTAGRRAPKSESAPSGLREGSASL